MYVRRNAVYALGQIKDPSAVEALIAALKDKHVYVRKSAVWALGKTMDVRAVKPLVVMLKDKDSRTQAQARVALTDIGKSAIGSLITALKDENVTARRNAALTLGEIKHSSAIEALIAILKDKDSTVQSYSASALKKITGGNFGRDAAKWQKWYEDLTSL